MTSAQVVETLVNVTLNSPSQDYTHPDDRTPLSYDSFVFICVYLISSLYYMVSNKNCFTG